MTTESNANTSTGLRRSISWKQGFIIAMGIPIALLPAIGYVTSYLWAASILIWALAVVNGFLQNMAYGELATAFPNASGIPGFAQAVFTKKKDAHKTYSTGTFIGGLTAFAYWISWAPSMAIAVLTVSAYLPAIFPNVADLDPTFFNLALGALIMIPLVLLALRGLEAGAKCHWLFPFLRLFRC